MGGLVKGAEDEREHVAVRDQQREDPDGGSEPPEERAGEREHAEVPDRAPQRRPVGARHQRVKRLARELVLGEADEGVVSHVRRGRSPSTMIRHSTRL